MFRWTADAMKIHRRLSRAKGFTLIELLVTVSIVGIMSGIALVNYSRSWMDQRLLSTTRDLENWLNAQRRNAIKNSLTYTITFDTENKQLISNSGDVFDLRKSFGNKHERLSITSSPSVDSSTEPGGIHFSFRGLSQNHHLTSNGTVELRLRLEGISTERCIRIISPIGMIRDGSATDNASDCKYQSSY